MGWRRVELLLLSISSPSIACYTEDDERERNRGWEVINHGNFHVSTTGCVASQGDAAIRRVAQSVMWVQICHGGGSEPPVKTPPEN
jgi:hypothetical protein